MEYIEAVNGHDPLCPWAAPKCAFCRDTDCTCDDCQCDLIARVRADTPAVTVGEWDEMSYEQGQRDALAAAAQRVEALEYSLSTYQNGYSTGERIYRNEAIAAIKG